MAWTASAGYAPVSFFREIFENSDSKNKPVVFFGPMTYTENRIIKLGGSYMQDCFDHIPEVEPDEWDLEMLAAAAADNDDEYISLADVLESLGMSLDELRD